MDDNQKVTMTPEQLKDIIQGSMVAAIQELKKPDPEEVEAKEVERKRRIDVQQQSVKRAEMEIAMREAREASCNHMKPHPYQNKTRIVAPLHSDGMHRPICLNCQKEFKPFPPGNNTIPVGSSLSDFDNVTPEVIERWAEL